MSTARSNTPAFTDSPARVRPARCSTLVYESNFQKWESVSWGRAQAYRASRFEPHLHFYSEPLATLFFHPRVRTASERIRRDLLVLHLYNFLEFAIRLEVGPINEVCELINQPDFLPWLPVQMKDDARKIYVDECGHSEMFYVLMHEVAEATGVESLKIRPAFLDRLDQWLSREEPEFHEVVKLFFVIIAETLITGTIVKLPKDETVQRAVRDLASDHAADEGRHHAYFRKVFEFVWSSFTEDERLRVGALLPDMILAFLEPDAPALTRMLERFPEEFPAPAQIVDEVVGSQAVRECILESAAPTLRLLRDNRVFDNAEIAGYFREVGLVLRPR